jgi:hypothetical protein
MSAFSAMLKNPDGKSQPKSFLCIAVFQMDKVELTIITGPDRRQVHRLFLMIAGFDD